MDNILTADRQINLIFDAFADGYDSLVGYDAINFRAIKLAILEAHGITEDDYNAWGQAQSDE